MQNTEGSDIIDIEIHVGVEDHLDFSFCLKNISIFIRRMTGTGTAAIDDEAQKSRMRKTRIFTSVKTFCSSTVQ